MSSFSTTTAGAAEASCHNTTYSAMMCGGRPQPCMVSEFVLAMDCDRGCRVDVRCRVLEKAGGLASSFSTTMASATEASCLSTTKWDQ